MPKRYKSHRELEQQKDRLVSDINTGLRAARKAKDTDRVAALEQRRKLV